MTGLKETIFQDQPVSFWTFDLDVAQVNGDQFIDEIGNANPMIAQNDVNGSNYWLEQKSLNLIETADQYAVSIAKDQKVNGNWLEQFFEVPHTSAYDFPNNGEFTLEFLYFKARPDEIRDQGEPGQYQSITTPLIKKGSVISVSITDSYYGNSSSDVLTISVLGRTITIPETTYPIFNRTNHVMITYDIKQIDVNEYESTIKVYLNGVLRGTNSRTHIDTVPVTSTSASWLFGGNGGTNPVTDYATELLTFDQIAVYSYALNDEQCANHYRKTKQYDQMVKDDYPLRYWRMDELHDPTDTNVYADVGGINGTYIGSVNRGGQGPSKLITSKAPFFQVGGLAYFDDFTNYDRFDPILDTDQSFTLEFWFKSEASDRGMIFDSSEEAPPRYDGLRVWLNSKDNQLSPGNIQVSITADGWVNSLDLDEQGDRYNFNDNNWHYVAVVYVDSESKLKLYIDGIFHSETVTTNYQIGKPGMVTLMNSRPGDAPLTGHLCELAFYTYALQEIQLYNRWMFTTRYKIFGYTLLQGAPVSATLRLYDTITGELVEELTSSSLTGEYEYHPKNNKYLDILSKLPDSNTTRYRVHGPIKPAEYDDSHLF